MVETRELSVADVNSLTNKNRSELLADKFSFLFTEKALQKSEITTHSSEGIQEQLYASETAIYYNNSYETLAQFFDSASFAHFKEQYNKIIHQLSEWCSQFNIKPMSYKSSAAETLALFQHNLWTGFYSDHQTIIFSQVKVEMEHIVLALNNAEIVHDIKANCMVNLLEGIVVCSGGVVFAVNEAYRSLYLHNECFALLAEARYFLAKEIALKAIHPYVSNGLIRGGDEIHFAMALVTLIQTKLQIDIPADPLIRNALPDNLVNQFYKLLLVHFQPQNLAQALVQLFLPKINQILNTNQKEETGVVTDKLNQLLSSLGEHEHELEEALITIEDKEGWLKYIIIHLLIRECFFDLDILSIKSSPERKSTLDVLTLCFGEMLYSKIIVSTREKDNILARYNSAFNLIFDDDLLLHYGKKSWKINLDINLEISINLMQIYVPSFYQLFGYNPAESNPKLLKALLLRLYWETQTTEYPFDGSNKNDIFTWLAHEKTIPAHEKTIPDYERLCLHYKSLTNLTGQEEVAHSAQP